MKIHNVREGLWFVLWARTQDGGPDELVMTSFEDLINYGGQFRWVEDMKGIFTTKREAQSFYKKELDKI